MKKKDKGANKKPHNSDHLFRSARNDLYALRKESRQQGVIFQLALFLSLLPMTTPNNLSHLAIANEDGVSIDLADPTLSPEELKEAVKALKGCLIAYKKAYQLGRYKRDAYDMPDLVDSDEEDIANAAIGIARASTNEERDALAKNLSVFHTSKASEEFWSERFEPTKREKDALANADKGIEIASLFND